MNAVGIDLGTSNSSVAVCRNGVPETLTVDGRSVMPSCVAAKPDGGLLVGEPAKGRASIDPKQTILAIKRWMGDRDYRVELAGRSWSPVEVSSIILKKMVDAVGSQLPEPVRDAVISVPAYFTNNQKEDTRLAGQQAGLNVLHLIPEPTAAAIAYGLDKGKDQQILVYDLGGGTFDVSILGVCGNSFDVVGVGGVHDLGGEDFDRRLIDLILAELRKEKGLKRTLAKLDPGHFQRKVKVAAEAAKKELSVAESTEIEIPDLLKGQPFVLSIDRSQYEGIITDLVRRTIDVTMSTLRDCGLSAEDVDRVVMVGGSTRIPLIRQYVSEKIRDPYIADNVDEVVAQGAAVMAAHLTGFSSNPGASDSSLPIEVSNVTAHSLGIRAAQDKFAVIIPRGTALPATGEKIFTTARDNAEKTDVVVFQGEAESCSANGQIGGFAFTGIERAPAGFPKINVSFRIDSDDILAVDATDMSTGQRSNIVIERFEPQPYDPSVDGPKSMDSLRIGVSPSGCDDASSILDRLGLNHRELKNSDFRNVRLVSEYDLLFMNCMCDDSQLFNPGMSCSPKKNSKALQGFVMGGGVLYVSDYAFGNIDKIFPGMIKFTGRNGDGGVHDLQISDPELQKLVGRTASAEFGPAYVVVQSVSKQCTVHVTKGIEPVLVSFPYGKGRVVYTSFHNAPNINAKLIELISFVILQTVSFATSTPLVELVDSLEIAKRR